MAEQHTEAKQNRPCRFFAAGRCRYGNQCSFVHHNAPTVSVPLTRESNEHELRKLNADVAASRLNEKGSGTEHGTCKYWKQGSCKFGSRCRFSHGVAPTPQVQGVSNQTVTKAFPRTNTDNEGFGVSGGVGAESPTILSQLRTSPDMPRKPCFEWTASGKCFKGAQCGYFHDPDIAERLREEERRAVQERLRRTREEESARSQAERILKQRELARVDAARKITREVDNCLVTFKTGLSVDGVVASFEVSRGRILNIPMKIQGKNIVDFFRTHGISDTRYTLNKAFKNDFAFVFIDSSLLARLDALPPLDGTTLKFVPFKSVSGDDAQGTGPAFGRTLTVQAQLPFHAPEGFSDALRCRLETQAYQFGLQGLKKEGYCPAGASATTAHVRISLELDSWDHARDLRDALRNFSFIFGGHYVSLKSLFLPSKYQYPIFITPAQYRAQKAQWDELTRRCKEDGCEVKTREFSNEKMRISIFGNDISSVGPMKVRAEQLARGTIINMWNRRLFSEDVARMLTNELQEATGALVQVDRRLRCLRAYGIPTAVENARERLQLFAEGLARNEYTRELSSQRTIRFFVEIGYPQLTETYGEEAVAMDLASLPKKITVTGDEEIRHRLDELFGDSNKDWVPTNLGNGAKDDQDCPICMCPVTAPTELTCGHVYCTQCLTHFVKSGLESTSFPLTCSADEARCGVPIAIFLLEKFLHAPKFQQLLETAFHAYMERNPDVLSPCKTPGCTQIFAKDASGRRNGSKVAKCPACFSSACAACGKNPHQGVSCEMAGRDISEEYINNSKDIRRCPSCQTPIYKDGGCNHVSCRCGKHICWRCTGVFATSELCYRHMRDQHGGLFDEDMDAADARRGPQAPRAAFGNIPAAFIEEDARARALARDLEIARAIREVQQRRAREQAQYVAAQRNQEWIQAEAARRARGREEAARAQKREGGWCVVM